MSASRGRSGASLPPLPVRSTLLDVPTLLHEFDSGSKLYISNNSVPRDFDREFDLDDRGRRIVLCSDSTGRVDDSVAMNVSDKEKATKFIFERVDEKFWAGDKQWERYARKGGAKIYDLSDTWALIEERVGKWIGLGYNIRVNCMVGQSRSGTAVIALLVKFAGMSLFDACVKVRSVRPLVAPGYFTQQLMGYAHLNDKLLGDGIAEENATSVFSKLLPLIEDVTATKDPKGKWLFTPNFMGTSAGRTTYPFAADPSFRELYEKKKEVIFESWEGQAMSAVFEMEKIVQQVRDARMRIPEIPAEWKLKALGLWILYRHRCYAIDQDDTHGLVATLGVLPPFFLGEGRNPFALDYGVDLGGGGHASAGQARPGGTSPPKGKGPSKRARKVAASAAMLRNALAAGITEDELDDMLASLDLDDD